MWTRNSPRLTSTLVAFTFSLIAHWMMFLHLSVSTQPPPAPAPPQAPKAVPLLSEEQVRAALKRPPKLRERAPAPPKPKPAPKPNVEPKGQIVEIPPPQRSASPQTPASALSSTTPLSVSR